MAVVGGLQIQTQKSALWTGSELINKYCPVLLPPIKQASAGKWSGPTCTLQMKRSAVKHHPRSPSSMTTSTSGTAVVVQSNNGKGRTDAMGIRDESLENQVNAVTALASELKAMHSILVTQFDNWNDLCHSTITAASVSAAATSAINGAEQALGLSVVASLLSRGAAAMMDSVNKYQPSQLADEQRHAVRFFRHLEADIKAALETNSRLCGEASALRHLNKILAATSPLLTLSGALCSMVDTMPGMQVISGLGAGFTAGAFVVRSMSHALQLGAALESYRNCSNMEKSTEKTLRLPLEQREEQLGRSSAQSPLVR